jgi:hypothetical protein
MFKVGKDHNGKPIYEVSSLDQARLLAREYSRSLSRWTSEAACWVDIFDVNNVVVDSVNFYLPGRQRTRK